MLDKAISIANIVHYGQVDKAGSPYILHPLRLMMKMNTLEEKIIAVLHDTLEDYGENVNELYKLMVDYFNINITSTLISLTKFPKESYEEYIQVIKCDPLATKIKLADIEDNINILRLQTLTELDIKRLKKYHKYYKILKGE